MMAINKIELSYVIVVITIWKSGIKGRHSYKLLDVVSLCIQKMKNAGLKSTKYT
jgi:hypothetical protein